MDIKNLTTFIHVAEIGSFTKAAQKLGFSQSTVSFQIKQLESELQAQLFERINHTVVMTETGREVLKYAYEISELTQKLKENMSDESNREGHIRLATADSLCHSLLKEGFFEFRRRHSGIALKIIAAGTEEMFRLINQNEVDAILTLDNHIYNTEYVIACEEKVDMHFVVGAACPLRHKKSIAVTELINKPFILTEKNMSYRRMMDEKLAAMSLEVQPIMEIGNTNLICSLVEQGIGMSFLPDYVTAEGVKEGKIFYLDVEDFEIEVWKQLLHHRNKWISPQLKSVMQYCIDKEFSGGLSSFRK